MSSSRCVNIRPSSSIVRIGFLPLKIQSPTAVFVIVAAVESVPNSIAGLKEWRLVSSLTKKGINIDVIPPESVHQNDEDIRQLRIKLPAL